MNSSFTEEQFPSVHRHADTFFQEINTPYSWVLKEFQYQSFLEHQLRLKGFTEQHEVECLVLDLNNWQELPIQKPIAVVQQFSDMLKALKLNEDFKEYSLDQLKDCARKCLKDPSSKWLIVKFQEDVIAMSSLSLEEELKIVNFSGATTHKQFRNQGLYKDLLVFRLNMAKKLGYTRAVCQAISTTSAPILKKVGFRCLTRMKTYRSP